MPIPVADLVRAAVPLFGISFRDIVEPGRFPQIFRARAAVVLAAHRSGRGFNEIGRALGGRTGATISHAHARAEQMLERDAQFRAGVEQLADMARSWAMAHTQEMLSRHAVRAIKKEARAA